jgi:hypothetical protein
MTKRHEMIEDRKFTTEAVTDAVVIQVLLILIRHPGLRTGDVSHRLKGQSPPITMQHVRVVFDRYNLDDAGEKKTFEALNLLWSVAEQGGWSSTEIARATGSNGCHLPRIDFIAEMDNCAVCRATTVISRSKNRTVVTYAEGMFEAVEVQKKCSVDC